MVFSGRVHRPKTGPFHSKAGIYATKKCCNRDDNLFKEFRMYPFRGYDHFFLENSASSLVLFQRRDPFFLGTLSTSCSTLNHCLLYNITNTLVMSELTLKNSEVSIISEKTRESACAILPNKTLPNQLACTMEHHHKLDSRRVSCCLLSSSSFLV